VGYWLLQLGSEYPRLARKSPFLPSPPEGVFAFMPVKIVKDKDGKEVAVWIDEQKSKIAQRKDYWIRIPQKWWRNELLGIRPIERCLLISLRLWGAKKPSKSQLARELGITRWAVRKGLERLRKMGVI